MYLCEAIVHGHCGGSGFGRNLSFGINQYPVCVSESIR